MCVCVGGGGGEEEEGAKKRVLYLNRQRINCKYETRHHICIRILNYLRYKPDHHRLI